MKTRLLAVFVTGVFLISPSVNGTSARTIHPELIGFQKVVLNFSPQTVPGLDAASLEREIRERVRSAGLEITETAETTLFVQIKYQRLPACPEFLLIQTRIAVSEDAQVKRGSRSESVYVDSWKEGEDFVEPITKAAEVAIASTLGLLDYLLEAREYTTSVMAKRR